MPLPLQLPEEPETIAEQRTATTASFAGMMFMMTALTLIMSWIGRGPADSWALAIFGPISALSLFIVSGFTALKRTVHDTSIVAAGLVLSSFMFTTWQAKESFAFLIAGALIGTAAITWCLMRNLDVRIGAVRLMIMWLIVNIAMPLLAS